MESVLLSALLLLSLWSNQGISSPKKCGDGNGNLTAALKKCKKFGSELADVNQTRVRIKSCGETKKEESKMFLVNEVSVQTPVLDLLGCYKVSDDSNNTPYNVSSIPECFAHCHPLKTFGISGLSRLWMDCLCNNSKANFRRELAVESNRCRYDDSQSSNYMEVYIALDDQKKSDEEHFHINECRIIRRQETIRTSLISESTTKGYCYYPFCRNSTDFNSIPTKCEDSWDAATQACLGKTNSYLADTIQLSDCHYVARKIQNVFTTVTFWSSRRSYNADFSVKGNKYKEGLIEVSKCIVVSENEKREVSCNENNTFFCLDNVLESTDEPPLHWIPIIIAVVVSVLVALLLVAKFWTKRRRCWIIPLKCAESKYSNVNAAEAGEVQQKSSTEPEMEQVFTLPCNNEGSSSHAGKDTISQEENSEESYTDELGVTVNSCHSLNKSGLKSAKFNSVGHRMAMLFQKKSGST